jgi:hypothetical protein
MANLTFRLPHLSDLLSIVDTCGICPIFESIRPVTYWPLISGRRLTLSFCTDEQQGGVSAVTAGADEQHGFDFFSEFIFYSSLPSSCSFLFLCG